ncbi:uncharacterized protein ACBT44_015864 [Syngnathus typhle]
MAALQLSQIKRQTTQIIQCLFEDDDEVGFCEFDEELETDGPVSNEKHFDPVAVAESLKKVAESLTKDAEFNNALKDLKCALAEEAMEEAFSCGVDTYLKAQNFQNATDLAPEIQVIKVCFAFGLFVKKSCPELKTKAQRAVTALLNNNRVATWLNQQGGWEKVKTDIRRN